MYSLDTRSLQNPVLVSSTDGVGTKLKVAFLMDKYDSVGEDLVNHCVNDIAVGGAVPLFFLDYFATSKLRTKVFEEVIAGFVTGCKRNHCALIGGETAEMPDIYQNGEYDISGTIVGLVEKARIINGKNIRKGDILVGVSSNGLHTNGYSLARKILLKDMDVHTYLQDLECTIGEELLRVHQSYLALIKEASHRYEIQGISHITGGGILGNTKRLLQKDQSLNIDWHAWEIPPIFDIIQKIGQVPEEDMRATFNLGIGLVFIVHEKQVDALLKTISKQNYSGFVIGEIH
jgi:phosphoribosylformylglycinamidine cyclo-ligase